MDALSSIAEFRAHIALALNVTLSAPTGSLPFGLNVPVKIIPWLSPEAKVSRAVTGSSISLRLTT